MSGRITSASARRAATAAGRPPLECCGDGLLARRVARLTAMLTRVVAQRLEQLGALAEQPQQLVAIELPAARLRACVGRQQNPLRGPQRGGRVGAQFRAFSAVLAPALLARLRQVPQVQLRMGVLARQLTGNLPRRIVETQLVIPAPLDFLGLDPRHVAVAREVANVGEGRRRIHAVAQHVDDDQPVRIAAKAADQHFHADTRQKERTEASAGETRPDTDGRAVAGIVVRARALRMRVVGRIEPVNSHAYAAVGIAKYFLALLADDRAGQQMHGG